MFKPQRGETLYEGNEYQTLDRQWHFADKTINITSLATILTGLGTVIINAPRILSFIGIEIPQLPSEAANIACFTPIVPVLFGLATNKLIKYATRRGKKITDRDIIAGVILLKELERPPRADLN